MNIDKATRRYEQWLARHTTLVRPDLRQKHQLMAQGTFPFLRATFYRWTQVWPEACSELARAPRILAVGDLHIENFGTWRDAEGRLVWGVNDFDEAAFYPYANDLVRLATSALVAVSAGHLKLKGKDACDAILDGYRSSLQEGGRPFVLEEENKWLRQLASGELRDPVHFWNKLESLPPYTKPIPPGVQDALEHLLPDRGVDYRVARRVAGLGSLGRIRLVAIAECGGAKVAREAKALVPPARYWMSSGDKPAEIMYHAIISRAVRCPDPFVQIRGHWIVRRLSPDCSRVELNVLPGDKDEFKLLSAMGWETGNIHLGSRSALKEIRRHLRKQKPGWLWFAAKEMSKAVNRDFEDWRRVQRL